jgi:hypothetical protein
MASQNSRCPSWLINLYSVALYLYPKSFQENYREQMLQAFTDNYRRKQKHNSALFLFDTLTDLGGSMSQEHLSDFSNNGRIKLAMTGLFLALGILMLRPILTSILSDGFESIGNTDNKISARVFQHYAEHEKEVAQDLLLNDNPIKVLAGARLLSEWQSAAFTISKENFIDLETPITKTLAENPDNAVVWLAAYPACVENKDACDANYVLKHLRIIAPENSATWLYSAAAALERGDMDAQAAYLNQAKSSLFFDDGNNALNASWLYADVENPYALPWWSFLASKNLKKLESTILTRDSYVPGCRKAAKSRPDVKQSCLEIAKKIALQTSSSLSLKFRAYALAVELGDSNSNAMLELLEEQQQAYGYYLYSVENKDIKALAKAYQDKRQYEYAAKIAEANKQKEYPYMYAF